jgi:hypothetical protein
MALQHLCSDLCVCPVHGTPLFYAPASDDHACRDNDCKYGHGGAIGGADRRDWLDRNGR